MAGWNRIRQPVQVKFNILDPLMSADEKIMIVNDNLLNVQQMIVDLQRQQQMGYENFQVPFREQVPAATEREYEGLTPCKGFITAIIMHWPPGCNSLVQMAAGLKGNWLVPSEEGQYIALDAATLTFGMRVPCGDKERVWVVMRNTDGANPHTPSVIFNVEQDIA